MVVQCGSGDITEQFRCVRMSAGMANTRAAKFTAGASDSPAGSVGTEQSGAQARQQRQSHHVDRSGRSRNPTRGSVGLTRGLLASSDRSPPEFVSRPPSSLARPSCIFLVLLIRHGRVTRRRNMGDTTLTRNGRPRSTDCASERQRREPLGKGGPGGHRDCPSTRQNSSGGKGASSDAAPCLPPAPYSTAGSHW